jgi:hypothetical protein
MVDRSVALFGTTEPLPERIELSAGPVSATLEAGALRWIRLGDVEVLRGIAFLVRDRSWGTASPEISDLRVDQAGDGFRVTFRALCRTGAGELPWSAEITGQANGALRFTGTATPATDFVTNRTGFVVLHPLDRVAGRPVDVTHVDGTKRRARFPALVDPEQCFLNVRALSHEAIPGVWATCRMEGDAWEMEDHRNWLDASFKTYVRPLALPYPYVIKGGETVTQSVTLACSGALPRRRSPRQSAPVEVAIGRGEGMRMPAIGLRAPLQWMEEARGAAELLRHAGPQLVNARIDPRQGDVGARIRQFGDLAAALGAGLTLELLLPCRQDPAEELGEFAAALRESGVRPESVAVAPAEDRIRGEPGAPPPPLALLAEIYRSARAALPDAVIGGGTFAFFTELNRNWPPVGLIDYVTHMVSSVVHASDERSMMENLESFPYICRTVRAFAGGIPHRLIASGIGWENGAADRTAANPENVRRTMTQRDPRHRGLFGAAWTLASIAEAALGGISAITPAALVGEFGVVHARGPHSQPCTQPWFDGLGRAAVYPIYHVVAGMGRAAGRTMMSALSSDRARIAALGYRGPQDTTELWLANLCDMPQQLRLCGIEGDVRISQLDESTFETAALDPLFMQSPGIVQAAGVIEIGSHGVLRIQTRR